MQLPSHPSPQTLWPTLQWRHVSETYAGLFFRTEGGQAAEFGMLQEESSNHLSNVRYQNGFPAALPMNITIPMHGSSDFVRTGFYDTQVTREGLSFENAGLETRPINKAVRIWERM